jgi:upstream activation factor subunit UAF30
MPLEIAKRFLRRKGAPHKRYLFGELMATAAKKSPASKKAPAAKTAGAPTGFHKPLTPSAELAAVIGSEAMPRTEVTKKVWEYIKANNLQDAANKRNINADAKLKPIFGKDQVTMFEMTKLLSAHLR